MSTNYPAVRRRVRVDKCALQDRVECICDGDSDSCRIENYREFEKSRVSDNAHRSSRGNYLRQNVTDIWTEPRIIFVLFVILSSSTANIMGDQCDWSGNGLSLYSSQSRGVTPVYLRCSQGHITWTYPRGALRVLLRLPNSDKDFKGCIKVTPTFGGARLFLEGRRSLTPLFSLQDGGHKQLIRCFQSKKGQAAIYVEAADYTGEFKKEVAGFSYDLHPVPRGSSVYDLINEECRPCSKPEMARAFCTSDLVTRGTIQSIDDREELEIAEVNVKVSKVLRHSTDDLVNVNVGATEHSNPEDHPGLNEIDGDGVSDAIKLNMPRHCGPQHGPGEFVFMGRKRLGDMTLVCAPTLTEWAEIVQTMNSDGTSHCVLKS